MSDENVTKSDEAAPIESRQRKSRVSPWRNKEEFERVYSWLYGKDATRETRIKACKQMTLWKLRRLELTPATVLSTLLIVEIQLRDDASLDEAENRRDLKIMYSSAFTRFLNYMSSIMQKGRLQTMYRTAKELGLETFMVDLRHLCAHGQTMPSLEIFRRTAEYCFNWLKEFYWDHEQKHMQNVDAKLIRKHDRTAFDENVSELFLAYDAATQAIFRGCTSLKDARKRLDQQSFGVLKKYANINEESTLNNIPAQIVRNLSALIKRTPSLRDVQQIYISAFLKMDFFFQVAAHHIKTPEEVVAVIELHRQLFRIIAYFGFIEGLFLELIAICENSYEVTYRRQGSSFWAIQIAIGFIVFRDFKMKYKEEKEKNPEKMFNLSTLNPQSIPKSIRKLYSAMKVDIRTTLIFLDTFRRPWSLSLSKPFIEDRVRNISEFTGNLVKVSLHLVEPQLLDSEINTLERLIDVYLDQVDDSQSEDENIENINSKHTEKNSKVYTVGKDILDQDDEEMEVDLHQEEQKFGVWSTLPDGQDWHTCALGRLPWE